MINHPSNRWRLPSLRQLQVLSLNQKKKKKKKRGWLFFPPLGFSGGKVQCREP
ncbi:hypothetical protein CPAR01_04162 [Colletotrichum paranaense]|uniref:Uncharacterized protein n=1 Tax=Colletotrichum paranaense TaxID=1914294 RepID=A0ABQ9SVI9_9PEZI|nr:uncharacterized protein CPAR01_04162 [Colletotrichum paranaense]KAK1543529.1 hypothetical protein CPAR01_04162 [Colletotrichum paranaense]